MFIVWIKTVKLVRHAVFQRKKNYVVIISPEILSKRNQHENAKY